MFDCMLPCTHHPASGVCSRSLGSRRAISLVFHTFLTALLAAALGVPAPSARAQATMATATRQADLQVGGYFTFTPASDYGAAKLKGGGGYATLDFAHGFGVEINYRKVVSPEVDDVYEKVYEAGGRYVRHYGRFHPYARVSYGRGVFNFPYGRANLAYNLFAIGGGADFMLKKHVSLRADYDYQHWLSFPGGSLTPQMVSAGVAYHF